MKKELALLAAGEMVTFPNGETVQIVHNEITKGYYAILTKGETVRHIGPFEKLNEYAAGFVVSQFNRGAKFFEGKPNPQRKYAFHFCEKAYTTQVGFSGCAERFEAESDELAQWHVLKHLAEISSHGFPFTYKLFREFRFLLSAGHIETVDEGFYDGREWKDEFLYERDRPIVCAWEAIQEVHHVSGQ